MKIALVQCPVWGTYDPPLALAQLSGCLKKDGHLPFVFDLNIRLYIARAESYKHMWAWDQWMFWRDENNVNKFFADNKCLIESYADEIINTQAKVAGFSVSSGSLLFSVKFARMIKKIDKGIVIVFGGPLFFEKKYVGDILNEDAVNIVMPQEGELTLSELARLIDSKKEIADCGGIVFKDNGKPAYTGPGKSVTDLDLLPFLDFSQLPLSDYDDSRHIAFMSSRGCIQKCVFCSSHTFWPGHRAMSGERIFREIEFQKIQLGKANPDLSHVDFLDLAFNGNMDSLVKFCELAIESKLNIFWNANLIIRREMTSKVIRLMRDSGCKQVIFGIESGSQRVLDLMKKNYRLEDADRIIKWMHEAGITVTCNFMFGFPGEDEDDFQKTLGFLKRNAEFLDRVYPSRTYCGLEKFSYLYGHLEEFGINPNPNSHLYWESADGRNTYLERLRRCREFSELAVSLGIEVGSGVQTSVQLDELFNLAQYYETKNDYKNAVDCLLKYLELEPSNEAVRAKLQAYYRNTVAVNPGNILLNDSEYNEGKITLESTPEGVGIGAHYSCNAKCVFCLGEKTSFFSLQRYKEFFEPRLGRVISNARFVNFCGFGELLLMPGIEDFLDHVNKKIPAVNKIYTSNGYSLMNKKVLERLKESKAAVGISLHASNSPLHCLLTKTNTFEQIVSGIRQLVAMRKQQGHPTISLIFLINTLNIENLPDFVELAANLGVDEVSCSYMTIFNPGHLELSCYFKQELTNENLRRAEVRAEKLSLPLRLPPKFKELPSGGAFKCSDPWKYCYVENEGSVLACCYAGGNFGSLENMDFETIWNGSDYKQLRRTLLNDSPHEWCRYCYKWRKDNVNDIRAHINSRPGFRDKIIKEISSAGCCSRI